MYMGEHFTQMTHTILCVLSFGDGIKQTENKIKCSRTLAKNGQK